METAELTFKGGENGTGVVPFDASGSSIYKSITLPEDDDDLMPPKNKGGPLPKDKIELVREWIAQGANWPAGVVLEPKKASEASQWTDVSTSEEIHRKIVANLDVKDAAAMKPYSDAIPGTPVSFEMVALPGGEYTMGSPASEKGRKDDEGPQHKAKIEPFWMGKFEVTWNEYELFMYPEGERKPIAPGAALDVVNVPDAVTRPTKPYVEMSFGMGKDGYPAISMTHHAAMTYCKWLSAKTGKFYRLPTEAEWEYACRAGTTTAYSFGDDAAQLKDYAWFAKNSDFKYQKVGKKKPNAWGLFDMHGNVTEWCVDQYDAAFYAQFANKPQLNDWKPSTTPYPHVTRGGSWDDDDVAILRSAARRPSNKDWKQQDPQLPKSIWYLTDAQFLGFRLVRPLNVPSAQEIHKWWTNGVEVE
jgi:formylglycine-generating enzyme required for sulfatase activity